MDRKPEQCEHGSRRHHKPDPPPRHPHRLDDEFYAIPIVFALAIIAWNRKQVQRVRPAPGGQELLGTHARRHEPHRALGEKFDLTLPRHSLDRNFCDGVSPRHDCVVDDHGDQSWSQPLHYAGPPNGEQIERRLKRFPGVARALVDATCVLL